MPPPSPCDFSPACAAKYPRAPRPNRQTPRKSATHVPRKPPRHRSNAAPAPNLDAHTPPAPRPAPAARTVPCAGCWPRPDGSPTRWQSTGRWPAPRTSVPKMSWPDSRYGAPRAPRRPRSFATHADRPSTRAPADRSPAPVTPPACRAARTTRPAREYRASPNPSPRPHPYRTALSPARSHW